MMNRLLKMLVPGFAAVALVAMPAVGADDAKAAFYAAADKAAADYRDAHAACETLEQNAQSVCIEEAKLAQIKVKMNAEAQYRNTPQIRQKARIDIANAEFAVAAARCENSEGNDKNSCIRHARALRAVAIAAAKDGEKTVAAGTGMR